MSAPKYPFSDPELCVIPILRYGNFKLFMAHPSLCMRIVFFAKCWTVAGGEVLLWGGKEGGVF